MTTLLFLLKTENFNSHHKYDTNHHNNLIKKLTVEYIKSYHVVRWGHFQRHLMPHFRNYFLPNHEELSK